MNKTFVNKILQGNQSINAIKMSSNASILPSISLNQLQSQINIFKRKRQQNEGLHDINTFNHKQFYVCSPFYDRMKTHKQNCKCPYHRKKRLQTIPIRHTDKSGKYINKSLSRNNQDEKQNRQFRFSTKQKKLKQTSSDLNNSFDCWQTQNKFYQTVSKIKPKILSRNFSYDQFLKQCENYMLNRKGLSINHPTHIVRKGVREIFQFINNHLDYSIQKMTKWINKIQKDKDYGQFYIDRFKDMKKNYQNELRKGVLRDKYNETDIFGNSRKKKINTQNLKRKPNTTIGNRSEFLGTAKQIGSSKKNLQLNSQQHSKNNQENKSSQNDQNSDNNSNSNSSQVSQITLQKLISDIQVYNRVSEKKLTNLINLGVQDFNHMFQELQQNIINRKYSDDVVRKFETGILLELIKKNSSNSHNSKVENKKEKSETLTKALEFIRKYRNRKSHISQRNSTKSTNSKGFFGSKRNTQNLQGTRNPNSMHSKKSSNADSSLSQSQKTLLQNQELDQNLPTNPIIRISVIQQQNQNDEQNSLNQQQKILKTIFNHGQNVRRSKLLKSDDPNFIDELVQKKSSFFVQQEHQPQKQTFDTHKGFFRKAQKYLFDISMGKTIVKKDDSIFTAKRKVRVIKMLLKQNPQTPQADELNNYIKQVQDRCHQKTQKQKKINLLKNFSQNKQNNEDENNMWKFLNLENMGYHLIFYNLTSKIKLQDNEDLCILLNQIKMSNTNKLQNQTTFKSHFFLDSQIKKNQMKKRNEDILIQEGMRNMQFQPEIQSQKQQKDQLKLRTKRSTKSVRKSLLELTQRLSEQEKMSMFYNGMNDELQWSQRLQDMDEQQIREYYENIKRALRYAKIRLPQTFVRLRENTNLTIRGSFVDEGRLNTKKDNTRWLNEVSGSFFNYKSLSEYSDT